MKCSSWGSKSAIEAHGKHRNCPDLSHLQLVPRKAFGLLMDRLLMMRNLVPLILNSLYGQVYTMYVLYRPSKNLRAACSRAAVDATAFACSTAGHETYERNCGISWHSADSPLNAKVASCGCW